MMFYTLLCVSYLIGAISSAIVCSRLFNLPNPSQHGSQNPGTTNVLRLSGKKFAFLTFIGDIGKGVLAIYIGQHFDIPAEQQPWLGFMAIMGHVHPVYYRFKGGKGVATSIGVVAILHPVLALLMISIWLITAWLSRLASLAAIFSIAGTAIGSLWLYPDQAWFYLLLWLTIVATHQDNIRRLLVGKEPPLSL